MALNPIVNAPAYRIAWALNVPNGQVYPIISDTLEQLHNFCLYELRLSPESFSANEVAGFPCYLLPTIRNLEAIGMGVAPLALLSDSTTLKTLRLSQELAAFPERGYPYARGVVDRENESERRQVEVAAKDKAERLRFVTRQS